MLRETSGVFRAVALAQTITPVGHGQ